MQIDYTKCIKDIIENFEDLDFTPNDLQELQKTLDFLKMQVQHKIIEEAMHNSTDLKQKIEEAKTELQERINAIKDKITKLESEVVEQSFAPYRVEAKRKEIKRLEEIITKLEGYVKQVDNPEKFIQAFLNAEYGPDHEEEKKELMQYCATRLAYGCRTMESARIGETKENLAYSRQSDSEKERFFRILYNSGQIIDDFGVNLFSEKGNAEFVPNPEAIRTFLNLIRNTKLVEELDSHCKTAQVKETMEKQLIEEKAELTELEDRKTAMENSDTSKAVEEYITKIAILIERKKETQEKRRQNYLPTTTNVFERLLNNILGNKRKSEKVDAKLLKEIENIEKEIYLLNEGEHKKKIEEDPMYAVAYEEYLRTVTDVTETTEHIIGNSALELYLIEKLAKGANSRKMSVSEFALKNTRINSKIDLGRTSVENLEGRINLNDKRLSKKYEDLSPEAKKLVDTSSRGYIRMDGIKSRYIDIDSKTQINESSPFVTSLILETLMNLNDIRTLEDVEKFGIVVTQRDIDGYKQNTEAKTKKLERIVEMLSSEEKEWESR